MDYARITLRVTNKITCGTCHSTFDLEKNEDGCPMCAIREKKRRRASLHDFIDPTDIEHKARMEFISPPPEKEYSEGTIYTDDSTKTWGVGLMFNDFFSSKLILRIIGWHIADADEKWVDVDTVMRSYIYLTNHFSLHKVKGFPKKIDDINNIKRNSSIARAVRDVMKMMNRMGFLRNRDESKDFTQAWRGPWTKIMVTLTLQGYGFASLENPLFKQKLADPSFDKRVHKLSDEESAYTIRHLQLIEPLGFREHSWHVAILEFVKKMKSLGVRAINPELWCLFLQDKAVYERINGEFSFSKETTLEYVNSYEMFRSRTRDAEPGTVGYEVKNSINTARAVSTAKISLMRQLGYLSTEYGQY